MGYQKVPFNQTWVYPEEGLSGKISGKNDAIFLRNRYQSELDNAHAAFVNQVHYCEELINELKGAFNSSEAIKRNITAHQQERADLYTSLDNLLKRETTFETEMWKTTTSVQQASTINIKEKFNDSDVEIRYDSMLQYLKNYPEYASKSSFKAILDKIQIKEHEILKEKKNYNDAVSEYNYQLSKFEKEIRKGEDKFTVYDKILNEGMKKLRECRYNNSIFYRNAPEKVKAMVNIDTLNHRVEQFRNTLNLIKGEISQYQGRKFVEMVY